jgi:hypothetical protein
LAFFVYRAHNQRWGYHDGYIHVLADPRLVLDIRVSTMSQNFPDIFSIPNGVIFHRAEKVKKELPLSYMSANINKTAISSGSSSPVAMLDTDNNLYKQTLIHNSKVSEATVALTANAKDMKFLVQKTFVMPIAKSTKKKSRLTCLMNLLQVPPHLRYELILC